VRISASHLVGVILLLSFVAALFGCVGGTKDAHVPEAGPVTEPPIAVKAKPDVAVEDEGKAEAVGPQVIESVEQEPVIEEVVKPPVVEPVEQTLQRPIIDAEGFDPEHIEYPDATFPIAYAVVVSEATFNDPEWNAVLGALCTRHDAELFVHEGADPRVALKQLKHFSPHYVCVFAKPDELGDIQRCVRTIQTVRAIDADPYQDAVWAILTAYDTTDAMRMINAESLVVSNALLHAGLHWLKWFPTGVAFNEIRKGTYATKQLGEEPQQHTDGPQDTTGPFLEALHTNTADIITTSGHASQRDWTMGYRYQSGHIVSGPEATLAAIDLDGNRHPILSDNPKIYYSPGNCLIAHISHPDCMCLAWMHSGGVNQFFGHIKEQTRQCWAWGIAKYFLELQGRYNFAESVYLNTQSGLDALINNDAIEEHFKRSYARCLHITLLYGDPAWDARVMKETTSTYEQELAIEDLPDGKVKFTFRVTANEEIVFDKKPNRNRPAMAVLPFRIVPDTAQAECPDGGRVTVVDDLLMFYPVQAVGETLAKDESRYVTVIAEHAPLLDQMPTFTDESSVSDEADTQ